MRTPPCPTAPSSSPWPGRSTCRRWCSAPTAASGADADFVFYNQPTAPGVAVGPGRVTVTPGWLRPGAARVVLVASPGGIAFAAAPVTVVTDGAGRPVARLVPPRPGAERALLLAEIYRRDGGWRLRAVGQGYADGLGGLARDFGVVVDDEPTTGPSSGPETEVVAATNAERARHGLDGC